MEKPKDTDQYISGFPLEIQGKLEELRATIKKAAPLAEEVISYGMPAYKLDGMLVYFAAYAKHIGLYPTPSGMESFEKELASYKTGKGTAQFPLDKPLPLDLITKIVEYRMEENKQKAELKRKK